MTERRREGMTVEERLEKVERERARAKRRVRRPMVIVGVVASVLVLSLAACGRSEDTALRERVAALEKALEAQRQEMAQVRKDAAQGSAQAPQAGQVLREVRARKFVLEDENGEIRAGLVALKDGPMLALYDEKGENRAGLGVDKDGPMLALDDENGEVIFSAP